MRVAVRTLTLVLLLPGFAGCLDTASEGGAGPEHENAGSIDVPDRMAFSGCRNTGVPFHADPADIRALLPPGFEPSVASVSGTGAVAAQLEAYHVPCDVTVDGEPIGEVDQLWVFTFIEPPATGAQPDGGTHVYLLGIFTDSQVAADAFRAWGIPRVHLETATSQTPGPMAAGPFTTVAHAEDLRYEAEGTLAPTAGELPGVEWRFMMAEPDGTVTGALDVTFGEYAVPAQGSATVRLTIDGSAVDMLGPTAACICGGEDWTWDLEYTAIDEVLGNRDR